MDIINRNQFPKLLSWAKNGTEKSCQLQAAPSEAKNTVNARLSVLRIYNFSKQGDGGFVGYFILAKEVCL
jgi:hypothetical protein